MENKFLKWLSSETQSVYWHDSAIRAEQLDAFANGAVGMTTNPFLIQATLNSDREFWAEKLADFPKDLKGDEKAMKRAMDVCGIAAQNYCRDWFTDPRNGWPPNSPITIARKKSARPMIDTGTMRKAITYVVRDV